MSENILFIKEIYIKNFRSIGKKGITIICNQSNVFSGGNDAGKSNILKALHLFFENTRYSPSRDFHVFSRDNNESGQRVCEIKITFNGSDFLGGRKLVTGIKIKKKGDPRSKIIDIMKKGFTLEKKYYEGGLTETIAYDGDLELLVEEDKENLISFFQANYRYYYLPAIKDRLEISKIKNLLGEILSDTLVFEESQLTNELGVLYDDFKKYLELSLSSNTSLNTLFQSLQFQINEGVIQKRGKGEQKVSIPLELRGDGVQMMNLLLLLKFLVGHKSSKYNWILGIEEPEITLEIAKQVQLSEILNNELGKVAQLFITTHSPFVAFPKEKRFQQTFLMKKDRENVGRTKFRLITNIEPIDITTGEKLHNVLFGEDDRAVQAGLYYAYQKYGKELKDLITALEERDKLRNEELDKISSELSSQYPPKILIIEDEKTETIEQWQNWLKSFGIKNIHIYSSRGCENDSVETNIEMKTSEKIKYNPKVLRLIDRDGFTEPYIGIIENAKNNKWNSKFTYKYKFLPVSEFENFCIDPNEVFSAPNLLDAQENLEKKIYDKLSKYSKTDMKDIFSTINNPIDQVRHTNIMQEMRREANLNINKYYPGKKLLNGVNIRAKLLQSGTLVYHDDLKALLIEIKDFFT